MLVMFSTFTFRKQCNRKPNSTQNETSSISEYIKAVPHSTAKQFASQALEHFSILFYEIWSSLRQIFYTGCKGSR